MNLKRIIIGIFVAGVVVAGGAFAYLAITAGDGEVSQDISDASQTIDDAGEGLLFRIVSEESSAIFGVEEDLNGTRITVIGETDQVGGDIVVNFDNPSASEVGVITINSRDLRTDNNFRNQALRGQILLSSREEYEFITFTPTSLQNMPESVAVGDTINFDIVGDLSILDTTQEVTFPAEVTIESEERITGSATTTITWEDWGVSILRIPPQVANIGDTADLTINFVATPATDDAEATEEADATDE